MDTLWYKDAIIYEVHVRAFHDENGDGVGDFKGLTQKLDYLQHLGVTAIWILPFYPSPLKDDGYDTADYYSIHSLYGEMRDFKAFLREAKKRNLRVITELIINHTSDQHPWFQRARSAAPGSSHRDFYVWSDTPDKYDDTRIIFKDFEPSNWSWDPVAKAYYWHRFYSHQPDLNFDNPATRKAVKKVMDYWFEMGVDGMRLDAVPYLYEREGTDCENLPETHDFLKELRAHLDSKFEDKVLLAEANQWPEDAAAYFGDGDECHMNYHFPLMPRLFMATQMEDRYPVIDILDQTPAIPENCQWAIFLRNHDELTLEMVTDEERDYMYRMYAADKKARINLGIRRRLAPLMKNNRRRIELMNGLLLSLPGTPIIYYGDEIGMGDNIYLGDRDGVRTPMQWSPDRNAGFSKANPQSLYLPVIIDPTYHYESVNVEAQSSNTQSLYWWMKRLIALRKRFKAFGRGDITFLKPENRRVLVYTRQLEDEIILVVANMSRYTQYAYLDLSAYDGLTPVELFGRNHFPQITDDSYLVTVGPHAFNWFSLEKTEIQQFTEERDIPKIVVKQQWQELLEDADNTRLTKIMTDFLMHSRWFRSKSKKIKDINVKERFDVDYLKQDWAICLLEVHYHDGIPETYFVPLGFQADMRLRKIPETELFSVIAEIDTEKNTRKLGILYDLTVDPRFGAWAMQLMTGRKSVRQNGNELQGMSTKTLKSNRSKTADAQAIQVGTSEQSNSSIIYGDEYILKLFRKLDEGINPDLELGLYLTEARHVDFVPPVAGYIEHKVNGEDKQTLGILHRFIPHSVDGWEMTMDELDQFFERTIELAYEVTGQSVHKEASLKDWRKGVHELEETVGVYLGHAQQIGKQTAELHITLSEDLRNPAFAPETFKPFTLRSLYQSMRNMTGNALGLLEAHRKVLSYEDWEDASRVIAWVDEIEACLRQPLELGAHALRIRTHGDYHLGQLLFTGKEFIIVDFEGEPARSIEDRRLKRCPLRDVAGMLRSFHYAAETAMRQRLERHSASEAEVAALSNWKEIWYGTVCRDFLQAYFNQTRDKLYTDLSDEQIESLLNAYKLDKALYELAYELNNRPAWVGVPLRGIISILQDIRR
ncbi:maltose alpha-D-glucosyltransferase [Calditrichota bacterium]